MKALQLMVRASCSLAHAPLLNRILPPSESKDLGPDWPRAVLLGGLLRTPPPPGACLSPGLPGRHGICAEGWFAFN